LRVPDELGSRKLSSNPRAGKTAVEKTLGGREGRERSGGDLSWFDSMVEAVGRKLSLNPVS
jgi:hypothetical protein